MAQDFEAIELNIAVARDNLAATLDVQIALGIAAAVILGTLVIRLARRK